MDLVILRLCRFSVVISTFCSVSAFAGDQSPWPGEHHPWAKFGVGSWKLVRVHTQNLGTKGKVESVSVNEVKTTLDKCDEQSYTLRVDIAVDVAGKRFADEPKYVTLGFHGESAGQTIISKPLGSDKLVIDGREFPTLVTQYVINGGSTKRTSTVHFSPEAPPYTLRRVTDLVDSANENRSSRSIVEVIGVEMPHRVLTEMRTASHVKTVETFASGATKTTFEIHCADIPGGVVAHAFKQTNEAGVVSQRSTLELVNYEALPRVKTAEAVTPVRRGLLGRRR